MRTLLLYIKVLEAPYSLLDFSAEFIQKLCILGTLDSLEETHISEGNPWTSLWYLFHGSTLKVKGWRSACKQAWFLGSHLCGLQMVISLLGCYLVFFSFTLCASARAYFLFLFSPFPKDPFNYTQWLYRIFIISWWDLSPNSSILRSRWVGLPYTHFEDTVFLTSPGWGLVVNIPVPRVQWIQWLC